MNIEELNEPPIVGEKYLVPCVYGKALGTNLNWWAVLRPSHEDSKYLEQYRTIWKETENGWEQFDEVYFETDQNTKHHIHIDPRFCPASNYTTWEQENESWHNFITIESEIEWREMECIREMPIQRLFTGFGQKFIDDHKDKKIKCNRCPHKGALLNSMPIVDGTITCPLHGLKFKGVDFADRK